MTECLLISIFDSFSIQTVVVQGDFKKFLFFPQFFLCISAIDFLYIKQVLDQRVMSFQWKFSHSREANDIYDRPLVLLNKAFLITELSFSVISCLQSLFTGI